MVAWVLYGRILRFWAMVVVWFLRWAATVATAIQGGTDLPVF